MRWCKSSRQVASSRGDGRCPPEEVAADRRIGLPDPQGRNDFRRPGGPVSGSEISALRESAPVSITPGAPAPRKRTAPVASPRRRRAEAVSGQFGADAPEVGGSGLVITGCAAVTAPVAPPHGCARWTDRRANASLLTVARPRSVPAEGGTATSRAAGSHADPTRPPTTTTTGTTEEGHAHSSYRCSRADARRAGVLRGRGRSRAGACRAGRGL
ncbi:hypothetical protein DFR71_6607 [Nocardia alba]|uniref:Uncharacterized protein n=1 Tax=Nocardia alba TaxID=225051 RepID=A0A4R1F501_9NOCA|nr:hypothetical protein DFR71_6607 [Nocardia alba]